MKTKVGMLSLGCARNLVDAEVMLGLLKAAGFDVSAEAARADVAIVNTCCFIREAQEESIDIILDLCRLKEQGKIDKVVVCGCLAQRYQDELSDELKEVDAFIGVGSIDRIVEVVRQILEGEIASAASPPRNDGDVRAPRNDGRSQIFLRNDKKRPEFLYTHRLPRVFLTPKHFAYIKLCEGCNHRCSYCIIPKLRGRYRSRAMDSVLKEADNLLNKRRVSEINLIGQDTTMYGQDLDGKVRIERLLRELAAEATGRWVRLLYAHPAHISAELIAAVKDEPAICKYIDLPIQHINDKILKRMRRSTSAQQIFSLIDTLRKQIPAVAIRTTLIVGFPGETEAQFKELLDFIARVKFERLGLFKYSREAGTPAYNFSAQVPQKVKQARYEQALALQQDICTKLNEAFLGKRLRVLIDEKDTQDKTIFLGRTQYDAPEVDGCVYVHSKRALKPGEFVRVKIIDTLEYDLVGEVTEDRGQKAEDRGTRDEGRGMKDEKARKQ
jgi:ribosomal protein S12 methylthiotransferase